MKFSKFKAVLFAALLFNSFAIAAQILPNGGFEIDDVAPIGKPDFFRYRTAAIQGIEYDTVRTGNSCALFHYDGPGEDAAYYYAAYDASGTSIDFPAVKTGQVYELSFYYRTSVDFTGNGIFPQMLFANEAGEFLGNVAIEPARISSGEWSRMSITGVITGNVTRITAGIYYNGNGKAWVDDLELKLIREPLGPNLGFELDEAPPFGLPDHFISRGIGGVDHLLESNHEQTYLGHGAVKFDNKSGTSSAGYFYGMYDENSSVRSPLEVYPGDNYRLVGFSRAGADFTGSGTYLSAIFFDENGDYVHRNNSPAINSLLWKKIDMEVEVPTDATGLMHSVEYKGEGAAYFDQLSLERADHVINSSFEVDKKAPFGKADRWRARFGAADTVAGIETDPALVFAGKQAARFSSATPAISYYYGPYDGAGNTAERIGVEPKQVFKLSAYSKVSPDFSGDGLRMSLVFWIDGVFHSRYDSPWLSDGSWTQHEVTAEVPVGVNQMSYSIEFLGEGTAWFDAVSVRNQLARWYEVEAPLDVFESLTYPGGDKVDLIDMVNHFYVMHNFMETWYNGDGTWGFGYSCWPLIRSSANAASAYLHAYEIIGDPIFLTRAYEALDYLVADQEESGAFKWYNNTTDCGEGSLSTGAVMYEGGIATVALMDGYAHSGDAIYLEAATKFCEFIEGRPPNANANFSGFALWALAENYKVTRERRFLETALIYFEALHSFQLPNGMWADTHNQHIWYHTIVGRGLVNLLAIMDDGHPKKEVVRHATYKALNHIIRSQRPGGLAISFPGEPLIQNSGFPIDPMIMAYAYLGYTDLETQLDELTIGAVSLPAEHVQAHRFASFGRMLNLYYKVSAKTAAATEATAGAEPTETRAAETEADKTAAELALELQLAVWPNPADEALNLTVSGVWQLFDSQGKMFANGAGPTRLDVADYPAGQYLLKTAFGIEKITLVR